MTSGDGFGVGGVVKEDMMKVKDLSKEELKALVHEAVEEALLELLGDPDQGLELREEINERLKRSLARSQQGLQGMTAAEVAEKAGLNW